MKAAPTASPQAPSGLARWQAVQALLKVWSGQALDEVILHPDLSPRDQALAQWLAYGAARWAIRLEALVARLTDKPLKARDRDLKALFIIALFELKTARTPSYATVNEAVALCARLDKDWARGMVNAVLRRYLREQTALEAALDQASPHIAFAHPAWLVAQVQAAYPQAWAGILAANNTLPPMALRVNVRHLHRDDYLQQLAAGGIPAVAHARAPQGVVLENALPVEALPGWSAGWVSVQDGAAQLAALLLDPQPGERILDACAAPGGKSAHLLELADIDLWAVDISAKRLRRIQDNLGRLKLPTARLIAGDAGRPEAWWDGQPFDRILLDAPCTATGVIRRHPDIKLLRRESDVASVVQQQQQLLRALWPLLKPGGRLLYATCSVLPAENQMQIDAFCATHADARKLDLPQTGQILPGEDGMDGFFYALIEKPLVDMSVGAGLPAIALSRASPLLQEPPATHGDTAIEKTPDAP